MRAGQGAEEGLTLEAQTPADLREKAEREAAAADDDKKEQARIKREDDKARERRELGDRTRQDASADGFELGQSRADVIKAMSGMGDMFADAPAAQAAAILDAAPDPFADNYAALNGKTITQQVLVADTGKTATLRMDAGQALRDVNERETALVKLKACIGR